MDSNTLSHRLRTKKRLMLAVLALWLTFSVCVPAPVVPRILTRQQT
jgi:hypothetical protein